LAFDVDGFGWCRAGDARHPRHPAWTVLRVLSQLYYVALWALALVSVRRSTHADPVLLGVGSVVMLWLVAVHLVFFGGARFHYPLVPWLAAYAAGAVAASWTADSARPARRLC